MRIIRGGCKSAVVRSGRTRLQLPRRKARPDNFQCNLSLGRWVGGAESPALPQDCAPISNGKWQISDDVSREAERSRPEAEEGRGSRKQTQST